MEDDPFPTVLPMLGAMGTYKAAVSDETPAPVVYLHGHISSRFVKLSTSGSGKTQWEEDGLPGVPICVCATHMDGLVLALSPFNHSVNYRSAVIHGYASLVTDAAEKNYALHLITDNVMTERWANTRLPLTEAELKATGVIKVDVVSASAKVRAYTVGNDKADLDDEEMKKKVWTGVIPAYIKYGEPIPGKENVVKAVPAYMRQWLEETNNKGEAYSREAAVLPKP